VRFSLFNDDAFAVWKAIDWFVGDNGVSSWWFKNFSKRNRHGLFTFSLVILGVIGLSINVEEIFVCLVFVGVVVCFSRPLNVFGIVDLPEGKEHLIPENFSILCIDRRWIFNRDISRFESLNLSWWEFDVLTNEFDKFSPLFICNDDVRRTVFVIYEHLSGVNNCSDRLTIVDRLLIISSRSSWSGIDDNNSIFISVFEEIIERFVCTRDGNLG